MILALASMVLVLTACSKDEEEEAQPFNAIIKDGFIGDNGKELDPPHNITNIQVHQTVPFVVTITDSSPEQEGVEYKIVPKREVNLGRHQTRGDDYNLYVEQNKEEKKKHSPFFGLFGGGQLNVSELSFNKKGTYKFFIKPIKPGTFNLFFTLEKTVNGKRVGELIDLPPLNFNAIEIYAWSYTEVVGCVWACTVNVRRRYFMIKIIDGYDQNDVFLKGTGGRLISEYDGQRLEQDFKIGEEQEFRHSIEREGHSPGMPESELHITIKFKDSEGKDHSFRYKNIPIH